MREQVHLSLGVAGGCDQGVGVIGKRRQIRTEACLLNHAAFVVIDLGVIDVARRVGF